MIQFKTAASIFAASLLLATAAQASSTDDEVLEEIVVTGSMRVTGGGAQDINFVRGRAHSLTIPHPDTITSEGLFSEYDLTLPGSNNCKQLFCLIGEATAFTPITQSADTHLVGLGFATALKESEWQRPNINVVAVVDKSGSMGGQPLDLVRRSLTALTKQLGDNDQLSIVLYGDRSYVHLQPIQTTRANKARLKQAIEGITSSGSTNMEEGLEIGYQVARETRPEFAGTTRVMLFTDERPNVGATSADSFIGMAKAASLDGIGLTTIGVGVQFDNTLAVALSSTRGGNLFFVDNKSQARKLFGKELPYMVSELAHDLVVTLQPAPGYRVSGVYGVPVELMSRGADDSLRLTVASAFLSTRGGGLFATLAPDNQNLPPQSIAGNLLEVGLSYVAADSGVTDESRIQIALVDQSPSTPMQHASLLLDEYLVLKAATQASVVDNNPVAAYELMRTLDGKFQSIEDHSTRALFSKELDLTGALLKQFTQLAGRSKEPQGTRLAKLFGDWEVVNVRGKPFLLEGDVWSFSADSQLRTSSTADGSLDDEEYYLTRNQLVLPDYDQAAYYRLVGNTLKLEYYTANGRVGQMSLRRQKSTESK